MKSPLLLSLLFIIFTACESGTDASETQEKTIIENPQPTFVSNPQPVQEQEVTTLPIGESAPDFNLPGVDGQFYTLDSFKDSKVLSIIFTCNHCPTAQAYEDRMIQLVKDYQDKDVTFIAISPNSPLGLLYEELGYTDLNDDYVDMIERAQYLNYNFPYLYDGDTQTASLAYGPVATPHAFVFDQERKLQYTGRIDGSEKPGTANSEDLRAAIDTVLADQKPEIATTKTFGCSTKWGWKTKFKVKVDQEWSEKRVALESIDKAGIQKLLKNDDSDKLRLINVWATWCGPCIIEYPDFIVLQRMYGARDFEFVSLSADKMSQEEKALKFLTEKQSAVPNYIFEGEDVYELIDVMDKDWNGALPFTILVEPGGKVVWKHQGEVDFLALKRTIVEHELIGRYY